MAEEVGLQTQPAQPPENLAERPNDAEDEQQHNGETIEDEVDWSFGPDGEVTEDFDNTDEMDIENAETQKELDAANAEASMMGGDATTSLQSHACTASDAVPLGSRDGLSGGASGSNDPLPLPRQSTDSGNGYSIGISGSNPSQPKVDKSHIAGAVLAT